MLRHRIPDSIDKGFRERHDVELVSDFEPSVKLLFRHYFAEGTLPRGRAQQIRVPGLRKMVQFVGAHIADEDLVRAVSDHLVERSQGPFNVRQQARVLFQVAHRF